MVLVFVASAFAVVGPSSAAPSSSTSAAAPVALLATSTVPSHGLSTHAVPASVPSVAQQTSTYCGTSIGTGGTCSTALSSSVTAGDALIFEVWTSGGCTAPKVTTSVSEPAFSVNDTSGAVTTSGSPSADNPSGSTFCSWTWIYFNVASGTTTFSFKAPGTGAQGYTPDILTVLMEVKNVYALDAGATGSLFTTRGATSVAMTFSTSVANDFLYNSFAWLRCTGGNTVPSGWTQTTNAGTSNTCGNVGGGGPSYYTDYTSTGSGTATQGSTDGPAGAGQILALTSTPPVGVLFQETGLASGTSWSVTLNASAGVGGPYTSTASSITVTLKNAVYTYTLQGVPGYTTSAWTGTFTVSGAQTTVSVTFSQVKYAVSFSESRLPAGASWTVSAGGVTNTTLAPGLNNFVEPNGTYAIFASTTTVGLAAASGCGGSLTVNGAPVSCTFAFVAAPYEVQNTSAYCGSAGSPAVGPGATCSTSLSSVVGGDALIFEVTTSYGCTFVPAVVATPSLSPTPYNYSESEAFTTYSTTYCSWTWIYFNVPSASTETFSFAAANQNPSGSGSSSSPKDDYQTFLTEVRGATAVDTSSPVVTTASTGSASETLTITTLSVGDFLYSNFQQLRCGGTATRTAGWGVIPGNAGTDAANTCGNIGFTTPTYYQGAPQGTSSVTYTASTSVAGAGRIIALRNGPGVTFWETGLPTSTTWQVTLNGTSPTSSTTPTLSLQLRNSSYTYALAGVPGYSTSTYSGSFTVNGNNPTFTVPFTQVTYPLVVTETGLLAGTSWNASIAGTIVGSTTNAITENVPNGSSSFADRTVFGYSTASTTCPSTITISGAGASCGVAYTPYLYPTLAQQAGSYCGSGGSGGTGGNSKSFSAGQRCYTNLTGTSPGDTVVLQIYTSESCSVAPAVTIVPAMSAAMNLTSSAPQNSGEGASSYNTYFCAWTWIYYNIPGGSFGTSFTLTQCPSSYCTTSSVDYMTFLVEIHAAAKLDPAGLGALYQSPASGAGSKSFPEYYNTTVAGDFLLDDILALRCTSTWTTPSGFTEFSNNAGVSPNTCGNAGGGYSGYDTDVAITTGGKVTYTAVNSVAAGGLVIPFSGGSYGIKFAETGLPAAQSWSVTLGTSTNSSSAPGMNTFNTGFNNSFPYKIGNIAGWRASSYAGFVNVAGSSPSVTVIHWSRTTYPVTFTESGLPAGTSWSVVLNGVLQGSTGASIVVGAVNGTLSYTIGSVAGYTASPASGSVVVSAAGVSVSIGFGTTTIPLTFTATGLAPGTSWAVTVAGTTLRGTTSSLGPFSEIAGAYAWNVSFVTGYRASTGSGTVTISGSVAAVNVPIAFSSATYSVTFSESGLSSPSVGWAVQVGLSLTRSTTSSFSVSLANGTFPFSLATQAGYSASPSSGSVTVAGSPVSQSITFTAAAAASYPAYFTESGLPAGQSWSITISSTTNTTVAPGRNILTETSTATPYAFTIGAIAGYTSSSTCGTTVLVLSSAASCGVTFSAVMYTATFTEIGLPAGFWAVTFDNGVNFATAGGTVSFQVAAGSYTYTVGPVSAGGGAYYLATPSSGSGTIGAGGIQVSVTFSYVPATAPATHAQLLSSLLLANPGARFLSSLELARTTSELRVGA